ncbi:cell wall protein IFF6-like [Lingula anatina]|uniref:Cell wall protein IFF6-like n=1 Tax=Lingula anatina TaxID=7574 RepID=A0A1S3HGM4_LINAN|nr:cell wall protein IFF6-like [Lingula anatina]|eukprot:XP_013385207.1 cell wall protein IFF6-like [Lingula anatina]
MKCDCCNKTNIITGENIWGHKIKECDAQFPDKKCDSDADYKATCNAEPTPGPPTPPFFVRFPWMYAVIVAAVVGIALSIVGLVQVYRRWKKSNEESLLHSVEESGDQGGGYSNERPQDVAGDSDEKPQDVAGDSDERPRDVAGDSDERLQDVAGDSSERPQNVAGYSNERPTDISPSVNSEDNETATLSGALNSESEQAANSLHDGPSADDTSNEDSMTDELSKSKQDKGDDQVGVHESNVCEDAYTVAKANPWLDEDEQQDSNRSESVSSPPQQRPGGDSFISVNPSSDPNPEDEFVRIAQRHNETDRSPEDRAEYEENEETFYKCTEGGVIRQATGDESSGSFFTIVKTGQQETGAVSPSAATHLDNPPAGDPNTVPIDDASNEGIWEEGGTETRAEVSAITAIDQQGLVQSQINGDVRNDNYDETSCKIPVGDGAIQETGNESITKRGQQETGSVVKGGQQETAWNPAQQSVDSSPIQTMEAEEPIECCQSETTSCTERDLPVSVTGVECDMAASPIQTVEVEEPVECCQSETDSATEQDLPGSGSGVECAMAASPRRVGVQTEKELKPLYEQVYPSRQDDQESEVNSEENDVLPVETPSSASTGDEAQQVVQEIIQNLLIRATTETIEEFPGTMSGLVTHPWPAITTDSRAKLACQMSGQASGGTVRMHHSDALSRPQVKANEHDRQEQVEDLSAGGTGDWMENLAAWGTGGSTGNLSAGGTGSSTGNMAAGGTGSSTGNMAAGGTGSSTGNMAAGGTGSSTGNPAAASYRAAKDQVSDQDIVQRCSVEEEAGGGDECAAGGADQVQDDDKVSTDGQ